MLSHGNRAGLVHLTVSCCKVRPPHMLGPPCKLPVPSSLHYRVVTQTQKPWQDTVFFSHHNFEPNKLLFFKIIQSLVFCYINRKWIMALDNHVSGRMNQWYQHIESNRCQVWWCLSPCSSYPWELVNSLPYSQLGHTKNHFCLNNFWVSVTCNQVLTKIKKISL
jgi:hypothetical protein